jgi:hypothetical protein
MSLSAVAAALLWFTDVHAAPVAVRFIEGAVHGYLVLRSLNGDILAYGEQLQIPRDGGIQSRLVFSFKDGSLYDETAFFMQHKVFTLQSYRLVQRGPSFPKPLDASFDRATEQYKITYRQEKGKPEERREGRIDLPADVYNGMQSILLKNLLKGASETIHYVAFTPEPKTVELKLAPAGEDPFWLGSIQKTATHYLLKPQLGLLGVLASLIGKDPPEYHYWIATGEVPVFLAFEGPLYLNGPVWRVELTTPQLPKK